MNSFLQHAMQPRPVHDEQARMQFVQALRSYLCTRVMPGNAVVFRSRVEPEFRARHGRGPVDFREIRTVMERDPYYQFWSALQRRSQEVMWEAVTDPVERKLPQLIARASRHRSTSRGSLRLDPTVKVPRYHTACDIHLQPGGYHTDFAAADVAAGAIYDRALHLYSNGATGATNQTLGELLLNCYREQFPGRLPQRVLDMGCAIGNSAVPWARAFPRCELHAIDVAAAQLRYGHARAETLGAAVHFSQQNAERTDFASASFDLVVSHLVLHETSRSALPAILRECHRLLRPGGVMLHLEIPRGETSLEKFFYNWETWNNNETFSAYMTDLDLAALAVECGFATERTHTLAVRPQRRADQQLYSQTAHWKVLAAQR